VKLARLTDLSENTHVETFKINPNHKKYVRSLSIVQNINLNQLQEDILVNFTDHKYSSLNFITIKDMNNVEK